MSRLPSPQNVIVHLCVCPPPLKTESPSRAGTGSASSRRHQYHPAQNSKASLGFLILKVGCCELLVKKFILKGAALVENFASSLIPHYSCPAALQQIPMALPPKHILNLFTSSHPHYPHPPWSRHHPCPEDGSILPRRPASTLAFHHNPLSKLQAQCSS